jgi:formylglycine-generating enzyme required for sulfatase activity
MSNNLSFQTDSETNIDRLGFDQYIKTLTRMIRDPNFKTPFCIGIYGKWGSGKTSFMRLLSQELQKKKKKPHIIPVWFNPWRFTKEEHLIIPFLKTTEKALREFPESFGKTLLKELENAAKTTGDIADAVLYSTSLDLKVIKMDMSKGIDRVEKLDEKSEEARKTIADKYSSIYYDIVGRLQSVVKNQDFRIAVFIDDLDRCLPEKVVELFEAIKLFLDIKGYIFVIGIDKEVVEKGITHYYGFLDDKIMPDEYLEKMIQLPLELPPIEPGRKRLYVESLLGENNEYKEHANLIEVGVGENPRALKRFVNFLAFMAGQADTIKENILKDKDEENEHKKLIKDYFIPVLYIKWSIIVFKFPDVHKAIKGNRNKLIEFQQTALGKSTEIAEKEEKKGEIQLSESLKEILSIGVQFPNNDWLIARYVHLSDATKIVVSEQAKEIKRSYTEISHFKLGDMVFIPKGNFLYGEKKEEVPLDYDYVIDVFPVTNKQYKEFLNSVLEWEKYLPYRDDIDWAKPYNWDKESRNFPEGRGNHPVVLVSWHDAVAYCKWMTEKDKDGYEYKLPSEKEWEKAARGNDGRIYPWGDKFDKEKCNTDESRIGGTTKVSRYPQGASPYQCREMAGNVWEWTRTDYDSGKDCEGLGSFKPVLRGGAWYANQVVARCAYRGDDFPLNRNVDIGFRCLRTRK